MIPPIANRFVAGETPAEVLEHARQLEDQGVKTICNRLGEHYEEPAPAIEDRDAYCDLLTGIGNTGLGACISIKPSQIGIGIGEETFRENLGVIVDHAHEHDQFVWIDMEDHSTTDMTLDAYTAHAQEYGRVGICMQANLKRTPEDLRRIADLPGKVRLVKGAYNEPAAIAHQDKSRVNQAYRECLDIMFEEFDGGIAVGSHDPAMIDHAIERHDEFGTEFELQMLMGVREEAQFELAEEHEVWQYAPYGGKWLSYFYRRAMERTENLTFALRAIVGR